jgi:hypothetical protein
MQCDLEVHRDINAAKNVLRRAVAGPWRGFACTDKQSRLETVAPETSLRRDPRDFCHRWKNQPPISNTSEAPACFEPDVVHMHPPRIEVMSGMRELIDTELDAVSGGHHGCHGHHGHHGHQGNQGNQGNQGLFDFGNFGNFSFGNFGSLGNIVNFGNIVIEQNIALQIGVAVGNNASVTNLLGSQTNLSSIASLAA